MVLVLLGILLIVIPTVLMITSLQRKAPKRHDRQDGQPELYHSPALLAHCRVTIIGERLSALWMRASVDLPGLLSNYARKSATLPNSFSVFWPAWAAG